MALDALAPDQPLGLAVSGGPDSLALLLLATAIRPGRIEAATADHQLRPGSGAEAALVAGICARLDIPHAVLTVTVERGASLQAGARDARYAALGKWARDRGLGAVATGHHQDDVAETLLMRMARGSGLGGLSTMPASRPLTAGVRLIRPLLGLRKAELVGLVEAAGLTPVADPANHDERHDRTRARHLLAQVDWLDAERLARSAAALRQAEEALEWSAAGFARERIHVSGPGLEIDAVDLPPELQRRLLKEGFSRLGAALPSGPDMDRALATLGTSGTCTLAGLKLTGGATWRLAPAPPRRG